MRLAQRRRRVAVPPEGANDATAASAEQFAQPLEVIDVRVRQDDRVERVGHVQRVEPACERASLRTAVDEHGRAAVLDQDRVALADVEHAHDELAIRRGWRDGRARVAALPMRRSYR